VDIKDASIGEAEKAVENVQADLGGTELSLALGTIFDGIPPSGTAGQRQIFVLTDGEDFHPEKVMDLVVKNKEWNRCFAVGLGRGRIQVWFGVLPWNPVDGLDLCSMVSDWMRKSYHTWPLPHLVWFLSWSRFWMAVLLASNLFPEPSSHCSEAISGS
jgi:hypothetical protein